MFDGSVRSSLRPARSSSNSSNNNRAFVEETKRLRQVRALAKRRDASCLKIQCQFRAYAAQKRAFHALFADLEKRINDIQKLKLIFAAQKANFLLPLKILSEISSIYYHLSTYNPKRFERIKGYDSYRLLFYDLFAESLKAVAPEYNMLREVSDSTAAEIPHKRSLQFQLAFVIESLSQYIATNINSNSDVLVLKAFATLDYIFSASYGVPEKVLVAYSSRTLKTFSWLLKQLLPKKGQEGDSGDSLVDTQKIATIINVVALAVSHIDSGSCSESSRDIMLHDIAGNILSVPNLHLYYNVLDGVLRAVFANGRDWFFFMQHIRQTSIHTNITFVANLIHSSGSSSSGSDYHTPSKCIQLLSIVEHIFDSIPIRRYFSSQAEDAMDVAEDATLDADIAIGLAERLERELAITVENSSSSSGGVNIGDKDIRPSIDLIFSLLGSKNMSSFISLIDFNSEDATTAVNSVAILRLIVSIFKKVLCNCSVCYSSSTINRRYDTISQKYINSLAFSNISEGIAKKIFDFLRHISVPYVVDVICYDKSRTNDVVNSVNAASRTMYNNDVLTKGLILDSLFLFSIVLNKILEGVDDYELFDQHIILSIPDIRDIIFLYKQYIFSMLWMNPIITTYKSNGSVTVNNIYDVASGFSTSNLHYLLSAVALFNSLYVRNERRRVLDNDSDWLAGGVGVGDLEIDSDLINHMHASNELETTFLFKNLKVQSILELVPQMISFDNRVTVFNNLLLCDKALHSGDRDSQSFLNGIFGSGPVTIMRSKLLEDAFSKLSEKSASVLKKRVQIEFVADDGTLEPGIDGGLFKSFMDSFGKTAFDPSNGLFSSTATNLLVPNHCSHVAYPEEPNKDLKYLVFIGTMLAKAIYEKILLEPHFCGCFLNRILGRFNSVDDMVYMDMDIHKSLMTIKHKSDDATLDSLELHFEVEVDNFGDSVIVELRETALQQRSTEATWVDMSIATAISN